MAKYASTFCDGQYQKLSDISLEEIADSKPLALFHFLKVFSFLKLEILSAWHCFCKGLESDEILPFSNFYFAKHSKHKLESPQIYLQYPIGKFYLDCELTLSRPQWLGLFLHFLLRFFLFCVGLLNCLHEFQAKGGLDLYTQERRICARHKDCREFPHYEPKKKHGERESFFLQISTFHIHRGLLMLAKSSNHLLFYIEQLNDILTTFLLDKAFASHKFTISLPIPQI